jgi:cyclophilin family peptidyl-prolyl cis-trans isomerase
MSRWMAPFALRYLFVSSTIGLLLAAPRALPAGAQTVTPRTTLTAVLSVEARRAIQPGDLELLRRGAQDTAPTVRAAAIRALGRLERPELLPDVIPALEDKDAVVRAEAANAVAQAAGPDVTATGAGRLALARRLDSERDPAVRAALCEAVGRLPGAAGDAEVAVERLLAVDMARAAARKGVRVEPAGPLLGVRLNWGRRRGDTSTVAAVGALRGLESLVRRRGRSVRPAPETLAQLRWLVADAETPARRLALLVLNMAGAADAATIGDALTDDDVEVRRLAAASPAAGEDHLRKALADRSPMVRYEALRAWGRRFQARSGCGPVLAHVDDASAHVTLLALDLLADGCRPGEPAADALARAVGVAEREEARPSARLAFGTGAWHGPAHALVSLARLDPDRARQVLPAFVGAEPWQVRMYAARAAALTGASDLLARLSGDAQPNVVEAAITGLAATSRHDADEVYRSALQSADGQLVRTAAGALAGTPARMEAARALVSALLRLGAVGSDTLRDPRLAVLDRLEEVGTSDLAAALEPVLRDRDPRVAERAARVLKAWTGVAPEVPPEQDRARVADAPEVAPPTGAELADLSRAVLRVTMKGGGRFDIKLLTDLAPISCARYARLAAAGHYDGLTFHRVVPNFIVQGGSPGANEYSGAPRYIPDEVGRVMQGRGTVGSSTRGRDTGDGQLYVNLVDSPRLDHDYSIFGEVTAGMDVVDRILEGDVIESVRVIGGKK